MMPSAVIATVVGGGGASGASPRRRAPASKIAATRSELSSARNFARHAAPVRSRVRSRRAQRFAGANSAATSLNAFLGRPRRMRLKSSDQPVSPTAIIALRPLRPQKARRGRRSKPPPPRRRCRVPRRSRSWPADCHSFAPSSRWRAGGRSRSAFAINERAICDGRAQFAAASASSASAIWRGNVRSIRVFDRGSWSW